MSRHLCSGFASGTAGVSTRRSRTRLPQLRLPGGVYFCYFLCRKSLSVVRITITVRVWGLWFGLVLDLFSKLKFIMDGSVAIAFAETLRVPQPEINTVSLHVVSNCKDASNLSCFTAANAPLNR